MESKENGYAQDKLHAVDSKENAYAPDRLHEVESKHERYVEWLQARVRGLALVSMFAPAKLVDSLPVAATECFFLRTAPAFDLTLRRERFFPCGAFLRKHKLNRAAVVRITCNVARLMHAYAVLKVVSVTRVVRAV